MKKIYDRQITDSYLEKLHLEEQFETNALDFFVMKYEPEEFLSQPEQPIEYFQFVVKGSASLYYVDENGDRRDVTVMEKGDLLGDMEFVLGNMPFFYTEALSPVDVLALPIEKNRERLMEDCGFLMYLLRQAARVKIFSARSAVILPRLEERLLYCLKNECPRQTMIGMETTASRLQCSRRQLQRVVKKLEEEGRLVKKGRGCYQLVSLDRTL